MTTRFYARQVRDEIIFGRTRFEITVGKSRDTKNNSGVRRSFRKRLTKRNNIDKSFPRDFCRRRCRLLCTDRFRIARNRRTPVNVLFPFPETSFTWTTLTTTTDLRRRKGQKRRLRNNGVGVRVPYIIIVIYPSYSSHRYVNVANSSGCRSGIDRGKRSERYRVTRGITADGCFRKIPSR